MPKKTNHSITLLSPNPHLIDQLTVNLRIHRKQLPSTEQAHLPSLHKYTINQTMFVHEWIPANLTNTSKNQNSGFVLEEQNKRWKQKIKDEMNFIGIGKIKRKGSIQKQIQKIRKDEKLSQNRQQKHKSMGKQGFKAMAEDIVLVQIQQALQKVGKDLIKPKKQDLIRKQKPIQNRKSTNLKKMLLIEDPPTSMSTDIIPLPPPIAPVSDDELIRTKSRIQKLIIQYNSNKKIHDEMALSQKNLLVSSLSKQTDMVVKGQATKEEKKPDRTTTMRSKPKISYLPVRVKLKSNWKGKEFPFNQISHGQMVAILQQLLFLPFSPPNGPKHPKFFIGQGNNQIIVGRILKQRGWISTNEIGLADFVWTQSQNEAIMSKVLPSESLTIKKAKLKEIKISLENNPQQIMELAKQIKQTQTKESLMKQIDQFIKCKKNNFLQLCSRLLPPSTFIEYMSELMFKFKGNYSISSLSSLSNYIANHRPISHQFCIPIPSSFPLFVNHRRSCRQIGDKKKLLFHLKKYCQIMQIEENELVVDTIHLGQNEKQLLKELNQQQRKQKLMETLKEFKENDNYLIKPGQETNRGNGITIHLTKSTLVQSVMSHFSIPNAHTLLIQKYLPPLLYHSRKFDIRVWCLLTSTQMWMFKEGYCRTSSKEFSMDSRQRMVHLTNDAVQKYSEAYGKYQKANKVSFAEMDKYMQGAFYEKVYPQIKKLTSILWQIAMPLTVGSPSQFQLLGLDFLVDESGKVWLIECNTNPCLQTPCSLLIRLVNNMLSDLIQIVLGPWMEIRQSNITKFGWQIVSDGEGQYWKNLAKLSNQQYWQYIQSVNGGKMQRED